MDKQHHMHAHTTRQALTVTIRIKGAQHLLRKVARPQIACGKGKVSGV